MAKGSGGGGGKPAKGSGKGGKNGAGGGKPTLTQRVDNLENKVTRIRSWNTIACKGFDLMPYHKWKRKTIEECARRDGKAVGQEPGGEPGHEVEQAGQEAARRLLQGTPSRGGKRDDALSHTPANASLKQTLGTSAAAGSNLVISWKEAVVEYGKEAGAERWKTDVMEKIAKKLAEQVPQPDDKKYELVTKDKEGGGTYRERMDTGEKYTFEESIDATAEVEELVKWFRKLDPGHIDWIAVHENSEYADILLKINFPAAMLHYYVQSKKQNPTEKYAFLAFVKENTPQTIQQRAAKAKKVGKTVNQDQKKADNIGGAKEMEVDEEGDEGAKKGNGEPAKEEDAEGLGAGGGRAPPGVRKSSSGKRKSTANGTKEMKKKMKELQDQLNKANAEKKRLLEGGANGGAAGGTSK
mmetsp:Transcript_16054/g.39710  ORF Transcript_16054/g.39710 Transcript_16054/m.39710 type:complete len:411 (+) Transcript_16054:72-1304(+)|eukprot:g4854.t1